MYSAYEHYYQLVNKIYQTIFDIIISKTHRDNNVSF